MTITSFIKGATIFVAGVFVGSKYRPEYERGAEEELRSLNNILAAINYILSSYFGSAVAIIDEIASKHRVDIKQPREQLSSSLRKLDFADNLLISKYEDAHLTDAGRIHYLSAIKNLQDKIVIGINNPIIFNSKFQACFRRVRCE